MTLSGSGLSAKIPGMQGTHFATSFSTGKAAKTGFGTSSIAAAIASLAFKTHERSAAGLVGPIDVLSRPELGGVIADVIEFHKDGMIGGTATATAEIGFFFDDL